MNTSNAAARKSTHNIADKVLDDKVHWTVIIKMIKLG